MKITTLIENNPGQNPELQNEHGLSLLIEENDKRILFDTGQSDTFLSNARKMGIDLTTLDYVLLSHGHYDHTGGMKALLPLLNTNTKIIIGKEFFTPKYKITTDGEKYNGTRITREEMIDRQLLMIGESVCPLTENISIYHHFPRTNDFELPNKHFVIHQNDESIMDTFQDEIVPVIDTEQGLVVIIGCSHVGIVNILDTIADCTKKQIYMVAGGTHLVDASKERIQKTIEAFKRLQIKKIAVSHCTGDEAIVSLKEQFGENFIFNNTGNVISVN